MPDLAPYLPKQENWTGLAVLLAGLGMILGYAYLAGRRPARNDEPLNGHTRRFVYERDDGFCDYCDEWVPFEELHVDHRKPRVLGGSNHPRNLTTSCAPCNLSKGSMTDGTFRRFLDSLQ
ncbi:MAG TPA: HNH endonuclease signature motif containing protein [Polyangiaceae bacterium]|jgi:hypothetical protein